MTPGNASGHESPREVQALLAVSRAVAEGADLRVVLDRIAREATHVINGKSASILLLDGRSYLRLAASYRLSHAYTDFLSSRFIVEGHGSAGWALEHRHLIAVKDLEAELRPRQPEAQTWLDLAALEGYRAIVSVPLSVEGSTLGILNVYRSRAGPWPKRQLDLLNAFGQHAASALNAAQLLEARTRNIAALTRVVRTLREQTHEYANRLHALRGLLTLKEYDAATEFVTELTTAHHKTYDSALGRIEEPILAALILAELDVARRRSIALRIDSRSKLSELPPRLDSTDAVTIVGNLLDNAFDAVDEMPPKRRRVTLRVRESPARVLFGVRDWGSGLPPGVDLGRLLEPGFTNKAEHEGVGLVLVAEAVKSTGGEISVDSHERGTTFDVSIPRT